jgi:Nickel/cobalt transporter regulator
MRKTAIAFLATLALPTLAAADPPGHPHKPPPVLRGSPHVKGPVVIHGPVVHKPIVPGPVIGHGPVVTHGPAIVFRGHPINRVHLAPFVYPRGWTYRRWAVGAILPPLFLAPAYYYTDWAALGLDPPQPGFQWVRYGPDLLLVNVTTGSVVDTVYGVFN